VKKPIFDVHYADQRTALVMEADLDQGWGKLQKTYGFFRQKRVPYHNDLIIRAQMTIIAQPGSFESWGQEFPACEVDKKFDHWSISLRARRLILKVPLVSDQPWRKTQQGRPEIFVEELPLLELNPMHWFDFRAWIVFHEGSPRAVQDVRLWTENKLIVPGGQFESNRRHH
jgi:hypothetical protein